MPQAAIAVMKHRCTVQRDGASGENDWNQLPASSWADYLTSVKCFIYSKGEREELDGDKTVLLEDLRGVFPIDTDVTEKDRITDIEDRQANSIISGAVRIRGVMRKESHLELILEKVAS